MISPHLIKSPVLGPISVKEIFGGVKTLILFAFDRSGKVFNVSACGDNCAKWNKIVINNNRLRYEFVIKRNITVIRGDSATGKTTLINMLRQAENLRASSGI